MRRRNSVHPSNLYPSVVVTFFWLVTAISLPKSVPAQESVDTASQLYFSANAVYNRKQYPLAVPIYKDFLAKHPQHEKSQLAHYGLGMSHFALKQYAEAGLQFEKLLGEQDLDTKIAPDRLILLNAQCLLFTNREEEALQQLLDSVNKFQPGTYRTGVLATISDLFFSKGDWRNTIAWAERVREASPSDAQSIRLGYQQGYSLYKLDQLPKAIKILSEANEAALKNKDEAWITRIGQLLGECHIAGQNLDQAESLLQSTLPKLEGKAAIDALFRLAEIRYARKQWPEAQKDYESFLKSNRNNPSEKVRSREASFRLARCLMEQNLNAESQSIFQALSEDNDEIAAQAILWHGRVFSRDEKLPNRYDRAATILASALEKPWYPNGFPDRTPTIVADIEFEFANALMLKASPDWAQANELLERLRQRDGSYRHLDEVLNQQAICLHKQENYTKSSALALEFLKRYPEHRLAGDLRFLNAENLFLLKEYEQASVAFRDFSINFKQHRQRWAAVFRIAQILHYQELWSESNKIAVPLLEKNLEGDLFSPLKFFIGENYFRLGQWEQALVPLESYLISRTSTNEGPLASASFESGAYTDSALLQLGLVYSRLGQKEKSIRFLSAVEKNVLSDARHLPLVLAEQGKLHYELGDLKLARQKLETFLKYAEDDQRTAFQSQASSELARVQYYLGWVNSAEKRHEQAADSFGLAVAHSDNKSGQGSDALRTDALLQQGIALFNANQFAEAAAHLERLIKTKNQLPELGLARYYAGLALAREKKWTPAGLYFESVIQAHPGADFADKALYEWAWCEREQNRLARAVAHYESLLNKYPKSSLATKVQSELADLNLSMGDQDAVIARLTDTIETVQDPALRFELRYQLASAYFKVKNYEESAPMFERLIVDGGQSELLPSILFQAGESRLALTETKPACDHFLAASRIDSVPPSLAESILLRLGETQNICGQHRQAQESYQRFLSSFAESRWTRNAQYGLGYALEKQEQYKRAIEEYTRLLPSEANRSVKMDKWFVQGQYQIGECYFNLQQYDKAIVEFASVDANARGYPEWQSKAVLELGRVLLTQGKKNDASDRMKEVMQRFPKTKAAGVAQKYLDEIRSGG